MCRAFATTTLLLGIFPVEGMAEDMVRFNCDILPILAEECFACHVFDKARREANLRLDQRESAVEERGGARAIAPGRPD